MKTVTLSSEVIEFDVVECRARCDGDGGSALGDRRDSACPTESNVGCFRWMGYSSIGQPHLRDDSKGTPEGCLVGGRTAGGCEGIELNIF